MTLDPTKAILYIQGNTVRYKQGGYDGVIKNFNPKPISAIFQGMNVIVTLENSQILLIEGPGYNYEKRIK